MIHQFVNLDIFRRDDSQGNYEIQKSGLSTGSGRIVGADFKSLIGTSEAISTYS